MSRVLVGSPVVSALPTLLTACGAICGFASITFASKASAGADELRSLFIAGWCIFSAMIFDLLDGHVARLTKRTSDFGMYLDSLCDVVSFGVAPAFLMLNVQSSAHPRLLWWASAAYVVCVVLRLARYNVEHHTGGFSHSFRGLPSPAAAGMLASVAIALPELTRLSDTGVSELSQDLATWLLMMVARFLPAIVLTVAVLMVSSIGYPRVNRWFDRRFRPLLVLSLAAVALAVAAIEEMALPLLFLGFVLASPVLAAWRALTGAAGPEALPPPSDASSDVEVPVSRRVRLRRKLLGGWRQRGPGDPTERNNRRKWVRRDFLRTKVESTTSSRTFMKRFSRAFSDRESTRRFKG